MNKGARKSRREKGPGVTNKLEDIKNEEVYMLPTKMSLVLGAKVCQVAKQI